MVRRIYEPAWPAHQARVYSFRVGQTGQTRGLTGPAVPVVIVRVTVDDSTKRSHSAV
jgi:hypothetical protein